MRVYISLLFCLYGSSAITVREKYVEDFTNSGRKSNGNLKDIRFAPSKQVHSFQEKNLRKNPKEELAVEKPIFRIQLYTNPRNKNPEISQRNEKRKYVSSSRDKLSNVEQTEQTDTQNKDHEFYMQKMADQLYLTQKHVSLLSDYQKYIINQDQHVKNYVFGQAMQARKPKPFSNQKQGGRSLSAQRANYRTNVKHMTEPVTTKSTELKKIVVATPNSITTPEKIFQQIQQNDHSAQPTDFQFVTSQPQLPTNFVKPHNALQKVVLVQYSTPQPNLYYEIKTTHKPETEAVSIPTTLSIGLGAYESQFQHEKKHSEDHHQSDPKYKFMYNINNKEKNNHFGHMESRTDKATYGYYFVQLPDGRMETVKYWADKTGYHAKVDYEGKASHPPTSENTHHKIHSHHKRQHN